LEAKILKIATRWNITFMEPNCVGVINTENGPGQSEGIPPESLTP